VLGELALDPDPDRAADRFIELAMEVGNDAELARRIKALRKP